MFLHLLFTFDDIEVVSFDIIDLFPHLLHLGLQFLKFYAINILTPFLLNFLL